MSAYTPVTFDPTQSPNGATFANPLGYSPGKIVVWNESPLGLMFNFLGSGDQRLVPAWTARLFELCTPSPQISWTIQLNPVGASGSAPNSLVLVEVYDASATITETFPTALSRQINIGNNVPVGTSATSITNDGNAAGTQVVEATPTGAVGSQLKWNNDGSGTFGGGKIAVDATGHMTGATIDASEISGTVGAATNAQNLNGGGGINGDMSMAHIHPSSTAGFIIGGGGWRLPFYKNVGGVLTEVCSVNDAGAYVGTVAGNLTAASFFSGTGSGTFNHGLGKTPAWIGIITTEGNSTETVGVDSIGGTSCHVNSVNAWPWIGVALG